MPHASIWIAIGFISGSIPWALIIGKVFVSKDIRVIGDGNPGAVNTWKLAGSLQKRGRPDTCIQIHPELEI